MPYKNPEDKRAWRKRYAPIQRHLNRRFKHNLLPGYKPNKRAHKLSQIELNKRAGMREKITKAKLRNAAIDKMGGMCSRCGFSDRRALQFDHIKPLRRKTSGLSPNAKPDYKSVLDDRPDHGLQLLCANCHAIKTAVEDPVIVPMNCVRAPKQLVVNDTLPLFDITITGSN